MRKEMKIVSFGLGVVLNASVIGTHHYPHIHMWFNNQPIVQPWTTSAQTTSVTITVL